MCEGMKNNDECLEFINNKDNIIYQGGEKVGYVDKIISKKGQYVTLNKMFYTKKYDDKKYFRYKDLILLYCLSPGPQFSTDMDIFHPGEFTSDGSYNGIFFHAKFKIIENYE
ncbi:hypothetical protein AA0313_1955 [Acetobacter indonesiensis NRIC 0313]|nr:hypothetical protein AA0313_1955 [Acetobacter indonesiensis NRIC 0313]